MKKWWILLLIPVALSGCNYKSDSYKALEQEKDSLLLEEQKKTAQLNQVMSVINLIEENFEQIRESENYVNLQTTQEPMNDESMQRVLDNLELIKNSLTNNRKQIQSLRRQLAKSKSSTRDLNKIIERLNKQIEEHTQVITKLREDLALKDIRIAELDQLVTELNSNLSDLQDDVTEKENTILVQESQLNKVFYVFGTRKELKAQNIFTRNGLLEEGFNKSYFLEADARKLTEIALYSKKARLLTNHPASSYTLEMENEYLVLRITNPTKFWEISHYLVIEVN
jgi:chromosome segregation ATPase